MREAFGRLVRLFRFGDPARDGKVVVGRNGVLFLDKDSNGVMRQITGRTKLSSRRLSAIHVVHRERTADCDGLGIAYRHVVCPNKESVETENLPERYRFESEGPTVISQYLRRFDTGLPFYDRAALRAVDAPFFKTDSHWTPTGALAYLRAALSHYGDLRVLERLDMLRIESLDVDRLGDLGMKLDNRPERCILLHLANRSADLVFEADMTGDGHVRLERCGDAAVVGKKAIVLHDSFAEPLYLFLAECYAETLFVRTPHFDPELVANYRPDIVWFFQAERFFPRAPRNGVDLPRWIAEQEKRKNRPIHGSSFAADLRSNGSHSLAQPGTSNNAVRPQGELNIPSAL